MASLATKYRPRVFSDVCEQSLVVSLVKQMCESDKLPNRNFLFIGPAGCGKTTLARIISNELNEDKGEPIELDAASHGSTEEIRQITSQAATFPVGMKYKIFIIDECFAGNSIVSTSRGCIPIKDIHKGDCVYNLTGQANVTNVFKNRVKTDNLILVRVNNKEIITTKDHLFFTDYGWIPACELHEGDYVYDYSSLQAMREAFRSAISQRFKTDMQQRVSENLDENSTLRTTFERISKRVSYLWKPILHSEERRRDNLFSKLWLCLEEAESQYGTIVGATLKTLVYIYLSSVWETERTEEFLHPEILQQCLSTNLESSESQTSSNDNERMRMVQEFIYSQLFQSTSEDMLSRVSECFNSRQTARAITSKFFPLHDITQSNEQPFSSSEDEGYEREERHFAQTSCIAWWERKLHEASDDVEGSFRREVDIRISCENSCSSKQHQPLSYQLQSRPRLSRISHRSRGGWCRPSYEIATVVGCQESSMSSKSRVDCVEIYQRGHNDKLFRSSFTDTELSQDYVVMYDLEIDGHPSYFINDTLVHNCHSLSNTAWQVFLKTLEEQPAKSIFIFATTNPEKIPATILSRVQTFRFSKISTKGIQNRLKYVIEQENKEGQNITYDESALNYIARLSNGGMRDSLTNLDRCLAFNKQITIENVSEALDLPDYDTYFKLLNALVKKDNENVTRIIDDVYNSGTNFVKWFEGYHSFLCNIIKYIYIKDISATMIPSQYADKLSGYSEAHAVICLKLANVLLAMNRDLRITQYQIETALTYLLAPVKK